ncbi:leucine-rich repeat protein, partial [Zhenpiania hominis]|uniref:leucine-rich repeat protein n=1 Tax=Zhenpiania hominis TaxID=2763644 RepID=UPI0039F5F08E
MRYTEIKYMEQEEDCGTESHSNGSSSDIREKRESGYHCSGDAGIEHFEGGNILNMSVEKKWHRWVAIAIALLMLATLVAPMNVQQSSAAENEERTAQKETSNRAETKIENAQEQVPETALESSKASKKQDKASAASEELTANDFIYTISDNSAVITGYAGPGGSIIIPETIGSYTVTEIEYNAFRENQSITSVNLPKSMKEIGYSAFEGC